jgi:transposase
MVEHQVGRRRCWRADDKSLIVAESYAAGAVVSEVARRQPQQLFAWRKAARTGHRTLPVQEAPMVVPAMTAMQDHVPANMAGSIVIEIGGVAAYVLRAVKAAK